MMQPYAIEVHSVTGDDGQLSNQSNMDEQEPLPNGKDVWSD